MTRKEVSRINAVKLRDAASQLGISERSLYRLIKEGLLQCHMIPVPKLVVKTYHLDADVVKQVKRRLAAKEWMKQSRVESIRQILKELKGG